MRLVKTVDWIFCPLWMVGLMLGVGCLAAGDLVLPQVATGEPAAGRRVAVAGEGYEGTAVRHLLYLPRDWVKGRKYPVIAEYPGNRWKGGSGDVDSCKLGYGISGGVGVIWVSLPFVDKENGCNATSWWGDVGATVDYCMATVRQVCREYGGDETNLFLAGFSRGAIACNFIGLHDDEIAKLWRGFICHSHYDGVREWGYSGDGREAASARLNRLGMRPQFISHEASVDAVKGYLRDTSPEGDFTFVAMPFAEHTDAWVLRDTPERRLLRDWLRRSLAK
ncbi:hypothetical protein HZ994_05645 [Akkermansiaceae bacterium]|nr:hypothetical protein HZ994_05645 [Akkermansiaceae bacterium]